MSDWIYLDHHTKTAPDPELVAQFARESQNYWLIGPRKKAIEEIFDLLGGEKKGLVYRSNLAEAYRHVFLSHYLDSIRITGRTHLLTLDDWVLSDVKKLDIEHKRLPTNEKGHLTGEMLREWVGPRTGLVSLPWAHPKTGVIQPIHDLIEVCKERDIAIHLDVSAAIGKLYFQLSEFAVDYLTFDGGLLGLPIPMSVVITEKETVEEGSAAFYLNLAEGLRKQFDQIENYSMEIAHLRDTLEQGLEELGAHIPYRQVLRLSNVATAQFAGIHAEQLVHHLSKLGIFATSADPATISFALNMQTTMEQVEKVLAAFPVLKPKTLRFTQEQAEAKNMRLCSATLGEDKQGNAFTLTLLIDEEDGVIADAEYSAFAPPPLTEALEILCRELLRKNYLQARRMTAELIEKKMSLPLAPSDLNLLIDAIDLATEACMDIPIEDIYVAPPEMGGGERTEYPGWTSLPDDKRKLVISAVIEQDVRPYVELDAGGVEVVKVEDNRITIAYSGNCTSCFSATGATLDAIGNILRHKVYPDLMVIPDMSLLSPQ